MNAEITWGPESGSSKSSDVSNDTKVLLGVAGVRVEVSRALQQKSKRRESSRGRAEDKVALGSGTERVHEVEGRVAEMLEAIIRGSYARKRKQSSPKPLENGNLGVDQGSDVVEIPHDLGEGPSKDHGDVDGRSGDLFDSNGGGQLSPSREALHVTESAPGGRRGRCTRRPGYGRQSERQ